MRGFTSHFFIPSKIKSPKTHRRAAATLVPSPPAPAPGWVANMPPAALDGYGRIKRRPPWCYMSGKVCPVVLHVRQGVPAVVLHVWQGVPGGAPCPARCARRGTTCLAGCARWCYISYIIMSQKNNFQEKRKIIPFLFCNMK